MLVAHSFGGGVVRAYAERYPNDVAGMVLVDIVSEQQYIRKGSARRPDRGRREGGAEAIPDPTLKGKGGGGPGRSREQPARMVVRIFRQMAVDPWQSGTLGSRPLIVLARADGAYPDNLDKPAAEMERARLKGQRALAGLSTPRIAAPPSTLAITSTSTPPTTSFRPSVRSSKAVRAVARP